jgi:hypothetical protein
MFNVYLTEGVSCNRHGFTGIFGSATTCPRMQFAWGVMGFIQFIF